MEKNDGGQAFPHLGRQWENNERVYFYDSFSGMTLRQWYKGMALTAMATCATTVVYANPEKLAKWAAETADLLIAEDEEFEAKQ